MDIKEGSIFYKIINGIQYKCYIVSILKEEKQPQIVYKYYGKCKQWWHYKVISEYGLNMEFNFKLCSEKRQKIKDIK